MSSLKEVAKLAGVSITTVSNVMRGSVPVSNVLRARVKAAIQALDYHPNHIARSLKTKETRTLGIVIPDITISFFPRIVQGAEHAARSQGYTLITVNTEEDPERESQALALLRSQRVDGILLVTACGVSSFEHIESALRARMPVVCLDRVPSSLKIDSVCADSVAGARRCVAHLVEMGHRDIAILTGPQSLDNERERLRGYKLALKDAGVEVRPELIWHGSFQVVESSHVCQKELSRLPRPSAVFASNGLMAMALMEAMHRMELRCPEDLAFATFDELTSIGLFEPSITALVQPAHEMGWEGASLLIRRIQEKTVTEKPIRMRLPATLQVGHSSQCVRGLLR
jgi:DNA-binding LacI/PurR family transcriptional regulator